MSLSDCLSCWDTPCTCGNDYEHWSLARCRELKATIERVIQKKEKEQAAKRAETPSPEALKIRHGLVDAIAEVVDSYRTHRQDIGINESGDLVREFLSSQACEDFIDAVDELSRLVKLYRHPLRQHFSFRLLPGLADAVKTRVLQEPSSPGGYPHLSDDHIYDELDRHILVLSKIRVAVPKRLV